MPTTVHCLDGTSYECTATTVGALKKAYERKHGAPADTQEVWGFSSEQELDNAASLADEDKVQLVIDEQTVTVLFEDRPHEVLKCAHKKQVDDVCKAFQEKHEVDIALVVDAKAFDATGVITTENVVLVKEPVHEYVETPLRMLCIHLGPAYHVNVGAWKLQVELPWLRTTQCIESVDADSWRALSLQLDGTRPNVAAFITLLTTIQERLSVATGSTLELQVPPGQRIGYWKCDVRNDDQGEDVAEAPSEVLTGPHYVRGIVQCTYIWNCGGLWVATWVARSLEYRRALPCNE